MWLAVLSPVRSEALPEVEEVIVLSAMGGVRVVAVMKAPLLDSIQIGACPF
jgi:hypothetical protein